MKKTAIVACGAVLTLGLTGCGASFEGSGSKDAASAEQLAMRTDDPWLQEIAPGAAKATGDLRDGVYVGKGTGMEGLITVSLLVDQGCITCLEITQEGESQSRGGYEAIRDGKFAAMIDAAQGSDIDAVSGATITTAGVRQAVDDALAQAENGASNPASAGERTGAADDESVSDFAVDANAEGGSGTAASSDAAGKEATNE